MKQETFLRFINKLASKEDRIKWATRWIVITSPRPDEYYRDLRHISNRLWIMGIDYNPVRESHILRSHLHYLLRCKNSTEKNLNQKFKRFSQAFVK